MTNQIIGKDRAVDIPRDRDCAGHSQGLCLVYYLDHRDDGLMVLGTLEVLSVVVLYLDTFLRLKNEVLLLVSVDLLKLL